MELWGDLFGDSFNCMNVGSRLLKHEVNIKVRPLCIVSEYYMVSS